MQRHRCCAVSTLLAIRDHRDPKVQQQYTFLKRLCEDRDPKVQERTMFLVHLLNGHIPSMQQHIRDGFKVHPWAIAYACRYDLSLKVIRYLFEVLNLPFKSLTYRHAAKAGHLEALKYGHGQSPIPNILACIQEAKDDVTIDWLREQLRIQEAEDDDLIDWLREQLPP